MFNVERGIAKKQWVGWPEVAGGRFFRVKQGLVCRWVPQVPVTGVGGWRDDKDLARMDYIRSRTVGGAIRHFVCCIAMAGQQWALGLSRNVCAMSILTL